MFTSVGAHGHLRPMAPLAQALRAAGHDVVVATAESFCETVEDLGLELLPVGITDTEAARRLVAAHPEFLSMPPEEASRRVVVDLFIGVLTPAILADLPRLVGWAPDVVVREEGEFAGPIVAAKVGVPWADHGWGPMRPPELVVDAAAALEPLWRAHGLAPDASGGAYRWLYLDPCPPSLQFPYAATVEVAHPVRPEIAGSRRSFLCCACLADAPHAVQQRVGADGPATGESSPSAARGPPLNARSLGGMSRMRGTDVR